MTIKVTTGHWRSPEVKRGSNLKNASRDPIFGIYTHGISLTYTCYDILTLKVIRGHQRSLEVKFEKCTQGLNFWHAYSYYTYYQNTIWHIDLKSHPRSLEAKFEKCTQGLNFWQEYSYDIINQNEIGHCIPKGNWRSKRSQI